MKPAQKQQISVNRRKRRPKNFGHFKNSGHNFVVISSVYNVRDLNAESLQGRHSAAQHSVLQNIGRKAEFIVKM